MSPAPTAFTCKVLAAGGHTKQAGSSPAKGSRKGQVLPPGFLGSPSRSQESKWGMGPRSQGRHPERSESLRNFRQEEATETAERSAMSGDEGSSWPGNLESGSGRSLEG